LAPAPSGKHQRIEFSIEAAAPAAAAAPEQQQQQQEQPAEAEAKPAVAGDLEGVKALTAEDRKRLRGEKFGIPETEEERKKKRAERFNLETKQAQGKAASEKASEKVRGAEQRERVRGASSFFCRPLTAKSPPPTPQTSTQQHNTTPQTTGRAEGRV
jgi:hypothetical protein